MNLRSQSWSVSVPALVAGLAVALALVLLGLAVADDRIDPEIETILRERIGVLQEAARLQQEAYRSGATSLASTLAADQALLESELELASGAADRVRIREGLLKNAEFLEKAVEELVKSAEGTRMDLLAARANRLRAKADLLLEQKTAAR